MFQNSGKPCPYYTVLLCVLPGRHGIHGVPGRDGETRTVPDPAPGDPANPKDVCVRGEKHNHRKTCGRNCGHFVKTCDNFWDCKLVTNPEVSGGPGNYKPQICRRYCCFSAKSRQFSPEYIN